MAQIGRREFLGGCMAAAAGATGLRRAAGATSARRPPNILFIFSDQQRWDTLGCYGQKLPVTGNLDRLAAEGVRFEHAFTPQPLCAPARSVLQTGLYATQAGVPRNGARLKPGRFTIARGLAAAGYQVGYIGKWHLGPDHGGYKDYWLASNVLEHTSGAYGGYMRDASGKKVSFPEGRYRVDAVTDFAVRRLRDQDAERPFFLFVSYVEPHHQNNRGRFIGPAGSQERWKDYVVPADLAGRRGDWKKNFPDYLGCCSALDGAVGRLREELGRRGLAENTLIVYASDHGCHFRTRPGEYKRTCHENAIRVPLILHGGGFAGGRVVRDLVSLVDLPPTLLTAAGARVPETFRGRALQGLLDGSGASWPDDVFVQISENGIGRAVRTRRWKYCVQRPRSKRGRPAPPPDVWIEQYLYDLDADYIERHNLVGDPAHAKVRAELAERLKRRMASAGEKPPVIRPAAG